MCSRLRVTRYHRPFRVNIVNTIFRLEYRNLNIILNSIFIYDNIVYTVKIIFCFPITRESDTE